MNDMSLSDIAAVTRDNDGFGGFGGGGAWVLIILFAMIFGFGGNGVNGNRGGQPVTEAGLCDAMNFNNLENAVGRLSDQNAQQTAQISNGICNLGYDQLRSFNSLQAQIADCCCTTQRAIDSVNYNGAINTGNIIQAQERGTQKILDYLCGQETQRLRDENMRNYIQSQFCGVVRYPMATTYGAGFNPFFGGNNCGCGF